MAGTAVRACERCWHPQSDDGSCVSGSVAFPFSLSEVLSGRSAGLVGGLEARDLQSRTERNRKSCGWKEAGIRASQRSQKGHKPKVLFSFCSYLETCGEPTAHRRVLPFGVLGVTRSKAAGSHVVAGGHLAQLHGLNRLGRPRAGGQAVCRLEGGEDNALHRSSFKRRFL